MQIPQDPEDSGAQQAAAPTAPTPAAQSNSFYGENAAKQQASRAAAPPQQSASPARQQQNYAGGGGGGGGNPVIYPIEGLSPYQNKWTIKARVTFKSDIKHWHNQRGEGKLFTVHLLDESGEIRATGFNEQCDAFYDVLQENQVFFISKCRVNIAKKQFSNISNEYELMLERSTEVEKCNDQKSVPQVRFQFVNLQNISDVDKDATIDVLGILKETHDLGQVTSKTTQKAIPKRDVSIVDRTGYQIRLTLWGKQAEEFNVPDESVIAFKGVKVSDFSGRSLSMFSSSMMNVSPDIPEAHELKGWYDSEGRDGSFNSFKNLGGGDQDGTTSGRKDERKTLEQVRDENLGMGESVDYFNSKATVVFIRHENVSYPACPISDECNKKVIEDGEGGWRCEKCDKSFPKPQYRYIMTVSVNDHTAQAWFSCFDNVGRKIMGMSADELQVLLDQGNDDPSKPQSNDLFLAATGKTFVFRCRGKQDTYNGQTRVRYQVMDAQPLNFAQEAKSMYNVIQSYA